MLCNRLTLYKVRINGGLTDKLCLIVVGIVGGSVRLFVVECFIVPFM